MDRCGEIRLDPVGKRARWSQLVQLWVSFRVAAGDVVDNFRWSDLGNAISAPDTVDAQHLDDEPVQELSITIKYRMRR